MRVVVVLVAVLAGGSGEAVAQSASREISGVVVDTTGGALPGAVVVLRAAPAPDQQTATDWEGRFVFRNVPPTPATLAVAMEGFNPLTLSIDPSRTDVRVILQPRWLSERVNVHAPLTATRTLAGTRTDTPLRYVPQAVSIVGRQQIEDQAMQGMADVVRYVPGVGMAQGEGNRDTPVFRGNASTSDFFVDGLRDDVQYFRDVYNVERVEVFKGPNAMIFGRGGGGGVINRVTRQAGWTPSRELAVAAGSWDHRRVTGDFGHALNRTAAVRVTSLYENSESYRRGVDLERYGVNPTVVVALGPDTTMRAGYEYFHDARTADRGIPSLDGRPVATARSTFFGNPDESRAAVSVNLVSSALEHQISSGVVLRNRTIYGVYDKFYQNVFPGEVNGEQETVSLSAYNNSTGRRNLFNQTDLVFTRRTAGIGHTIVTGVELARQATDNYRNTGFFAAQGFEATSIHVPLATPASDVPTTFRQRATDADNHGVASSVGLYVQDQIVFSKYVQAIAGLRYDRFDVDFRNNRSGADVSSTDNMVSPRLGIILTPGAPVSLYGSYTLSYLPRAGEQLSSLSLTNRSLDPEMFRNYEIGAKWDVVPALAFTAAAYRLDRTNVAITDPFDPTVSLLVDGHRTRGVELSLTGRVTAAWSMTGAYAWQDGTITRSLSARAEAGARLPQLPAHSFSIWNKYTPSSRWGVGVGIVHRGDVFTSTDNAVRLPAFTRIDAAVFLPFTRHVGAQVNVENLFDAHYYASAHNNNNITPGSPRGVRLSLTTRF